MVFAASMIVLVVVMIPSIIGGSGPLRVMDIRIYEYTENDIGDYHFGKSPLSSMTIKKGTEIVVNGLVKNANHTAEHFDYITEIIDKEGAAIYLHIRPVAVPLGGELGIDAESPRPIILNEPGNYTIKIFTWSNSDNGVPAALSFGAEESIAIPE